MDEKLIVAISAIAIFCVWLIRYTLHRSEKIQDKSDKALAAALVQYSTQNTILQNMHDSLKSVCSSIDKHDEQNGKAHRQAAQILDGVAKTQVATLKLIERQNGGTK